VVVTWRKVGAIYLVFAVLLAWMLVVERAEPPPAPAAEDPTAPERSVLGTRSDAVRRVTLRRGGQSVTADLEGDRWRITEPKGAPLPSDLIAATVATLTAGQVADVVGGEGADLAAFGLSAPSAEIELWIRDRPEPLTVVLGDLSPTRTAQYAKVTDRPAVYLVGRNVSYYMDRVFDEAGKAG
jgi:hypothetical protein